MAGNAMSSFASNRNHQHLHH